MALPTSPDDDQGSSVAVVPYNQPIAILGTLGVKPINPVLIAGTGLTPSGSGALPLAPASGAPPCVSGSCPYTSPAGSSSPSSGAGASPLLSAPVLRAEPRAWWLELYAGIPLWVWLLVGALTFLVVVRK